MWAISKGWKPGTDNAETKKFLLQNRMRALNELVKHMLIGQYARAEGVEPDEKSLKLQKSLFVRSVKKPKASFASLIELFKPEERKMVQRVVRGDAVTMAVLQHSTSNDLYHVTEEEYTNRVKFVSDWNARADKTNSFVRARAAKAKAEILGGAYFADVAKKYADFAPEQGVEWETFHLDEFEGDDPLGQWLARSDTGDISDPIDLDDSISIVGLKMKYVSDVSESNKPPVYAYDVVRCPFYAYERQEDFDGDRESVIEDIIDKRRQVAMMNLHDNLVKKAKIEFPCGNNLFHPPKKNAREKAKDIKQKKGRGHAHKQRDVKVPRKPNKRNAAPASEPARSGSVLQSVEKGTPEKKK